MSNNRYPPASRLEDFDSPFLDSEMFAPASNWETGSEGAFAPVSDWETDGADAFVSASDHETGGAGALVKDCTSGAFYGLLRRRTAVTVPYRWICQLQITRVDSRDLAKGKTTVVAGTGILISPRHVLTAAHLLKYTAKDARNQPVTYEARSIRVAPARIGNDRQPDIYDATPAFIAPLWDPAKADMAHDYALLTLSKPIGDEASARIGGLKLLYWGSQASRSGATVRVLPHAQLQGVTAYNAGYTDLRNIQLREVAAKLADVNAGPTMKIEGTQSWEGRVGSPVWVRLGAEVCLVGMMVRNGTHVRRLSADMCQQLRDWMKNASDICGSVAVTPPTREMMLDEADAGAKPACQCGQPKNEARDSEYEVEYAAGHDAGRAHEAEHGAEHDAEGADGDHAWGSGHRLDEAEADGSLFDPASLEVAHGREAGAVCNFEREHFGHVGSESEAIDQAGDEGEAFPWQAVPGDDEGEISTFETESDEEAIDFGELAANGETDGSVDGPWRDGGRAYEREDHPFVARERQVPAVKPTPVKARILWPALGFPGVIAPRENATGTALSDGDATRCVTVLLLSNRKSLSKAEAAAYLRVVPWNERGRRHLPADATNAFLEEQLEVRNNEVGPKLVLKTPDKSAATLIAFGGNKDGTNAITVSLANSVRDFYVKQELRYLHEIRIHESVSARLQDGRYHLFWNNQAAGETVPSDEMALLLRQFARPRREKLALWKTHGTYLLDEYEYEYGSMHAPYCSTLAPKVRAEVLHPLFVERRPHEPMRIGHITDLHVDVRADVYEANLKAEGLEANYNNWNRNTLDLYEEARGDSDVVLLTGDLVDYGRGHWGQDATEHLQEDGLYHNDRNWFLFSYLIASGDRYTKPVYTILGNHDWRINPYPPFAIGAPGANSLFFENADATADQKLRAAHGAGYERKFSYNATAKGKLQMAVEQTGASAKSLVRMFFQAKTMDEKGTPAHTTVESVEWYLLAINPFLDYAFPLPGGQALLMLDWAEDEDLLMPIQEAGESWPYMLWQISRASEATPRARTCLTALQQQLVARFIGMAGKAKIVALHAPVIGPYPDWFEDEMLIGRKTYDPSAVGRGPTNYQSKKPDGSIEKWNGHPIFAVTPKGGASGMQADYCSFEPESRKRFITDVAKPASNIRLVLTGHIHRNGLFVVHVPGAERGQAVAGEQLVYAVRESDVKSVRAPAAASTPQGTRGPLYINTTSAGPRGTWYPTKGKAQKVDPGYAHAEIARDGTIGLVRFRSRRVVPMSRPKTATTQQPQRERGVEAATGQSPLEALLAEYASSR